MAVLKPTPSTVKVFLALAENSWTYQGCEPVLASREWVEVDCDIRGARSGARRLREAGPGCPATGGLSHYALGKQAGLSGSTIKDIEMEIDRQFGSREISADGDLQQGG